MIFEMYIEKVFFFAVLHIYSNTAEAIYVVVARALSVWLAVRYVCRPDVYPALRYLTAGWDDVCRCARRIFIMVGARSSFLGAVVGPV